MTNKEAMDWIRNIKEYYIRGGDEEFDEKRKTALEMAIKALEQECCYVSKLTQKAYEDGKKDGYVQAKVEQEPKTEQFAEWELVEPQESEE